MRYFLVLMFGVAIGWSLDDMAFHIVGTSFAQVITGASTATGFDCDSAIKQQLELIQQIARSCPILASPR